MQSSVVRDHAWEPKARQAPQLCARDQGRPAQRAQPGSRAERQPGSQAAGQPGSQAARQAGSQAARQPNKKKYIYIYIYIYIIGSQAARQACSRAAGPTARARQTASDPGRPGSQAARQACSRAHQAAPPARQGDALELTFTKHLLKGIREIHAIDMVPTGGRTQTRSRATQNAEKTSGQLMES